MGGCRRVFFGRTSVFGQVSKVTLSVILQRLLASKDTVS
jgi:hypothetical protein